MPETLMSSSTRSQRLNVEKMGLMEKLTILPNVIMSYAESFLSIFMGFFRGFNQLPPTLHRNFTYTFIRSMVRRMSTRQLHAITPSTDSAYATFCKERGVTPNTISLEDGTTAHWIGPSSASNILINFHGGGYSIPGGLHQFDFMHQLQISLTQKGPSSLSILSLSYDLAPVAPYPRQLQQAAALLEYVLHTLHRPPSTIFLAGDSAGGNLALSLLSHLAHPHPSTSTPIPRIALAAPFRGLVLISPWLSFSTTRPAFFTNAHKDLINTTAGIRWAEAFLNASYPFAPDVTDAYNEPHEAADEWWEDLPVTDVLVVGGADECLVDSIREFAETLMRVRDRVTAEGRGNLRHVDVLIAKGEAHDMPNMDFQMGYTELGKQALMIRSWLAARL